MYQKKINQNKNKHTSGDSAQSVLMVNKWLSEFRWVGKSATYADVSGKPIQVTTNETVKIMMW